MLTITTNKTEVKGIAERRITERALPITDFWTKRIVNLLGFSDSDRQTIIHNLRENRAGGDGRGTGRHIHGGRRCVCRGKGHDPDRAAVRRRMFHPVDPGRSGKPGRTGRRTGRTGTGSRGYATRARRQSDNTTDGLLPLLQSGANDRSTGRIIGGGSERTGVTRM